MKKKLIFLGLIVFIGYILLFPKDAVSAASHGLVLWYEKVLPTLLPFAILSNILIHSGYVQMLIAPFAPIVKCLLPVSNQGAFVLLSGFLFGFPMGSKNCAELLKAGQIEQEEADVLFAITNNISPVFISSFILTGQLKMPSLTLLSYLVLYLPPLLLGSVLLHQNKTHKYTELSTDKHTVAPAATPGNTSITYTNPMAEKKPASRSQMNFKIIDAGIMNGFETLTRLGGYIMLFSMIASMIQKLPISSDIALLLTGITEITNGISQIPLSQKNASTQYILAMAFTAFGGLSGIAQTSSMIKETTLSLKNYCLMKLVLTACSTLLATALMLWLSL